MNTIHTVGERSYSVDGRLTEWCFHAHPFDWLRDRLYLHRIRGKD